jgi:hypothetical protein
MTAGGPQTPQEEDALRWWRAYQLADGQQTGELRRLAEAGDDHARRQLASSLAAAGDTDEALAVIGPLCEAGDQVAREWRIRWLGAAGRIEELRGLIPDEQVAVILAERLARDGRLAELRALAEEDGPHAARVRVWMGSEQGGIDVMRIAAELGDEQARLRVARWDDHH